MSGGDAKVACQQCSENFSREDVKETYDEQLEICGFICNPCCIKSAESARRCQISDCKTKPDSGPTGYRTLPSKFYDLPEGEVKRRIIKQFGIFRNVRACCNMCYVRISKSVVQTNIVYGDALPRGSKSSNSKSSKHISQSTVEKKAQGRDDRLAEYTGPKFTRRSGSALFWDRAKIQENIAASNVKDAVFGQSNNVNAEDKIGTLNKRNQGDEMDLVASNAETHESVNETNSARPEKLEIEKSVAKFDAKGNKMREFSYSSTPISPTSMRFRRIQPKVSRFDEFDLSSDDLGDNIGLDSPSSGRKRSRGNDDETWSPGKVKKEKTEGKTLQVKRSVSLNSNVMSDFVSCTGCRKICSIKETQPVFDKNKHVNVRLCPGCMKESKDGGFHCPVKGCSTSKESITIVDISIDWQAVADETVGVLSEISVTKYTKKCCQNCWKKIDDAIKKNGKRKGRNNADEQVFTMCRNCCKIVPMKTTFPNIEENGRKCGVLCQLCSGGQGSTKNREGKKQQISPKKLKGCEQKSIGFCTAKGCVHAGEKEPIQLVSGKKILRNYLDEKVLRAEFNLADDMDYCCRSCHARIKWFVAAMRKKELGTRADSKSSLKNLTPKGKEADEKNRNEQLSILNEDENSRDCESQSDHDSISKESLLIDQHHSSNDASLSGASMTIKGLENEPAVMKTEVAVEPKENTKIDSAKDLEENETWPVKKASDFQAQSFSSKNPIIIPSASASAVAGHPPVLQVGGQQFVLNVISRSEKECQTDQLGTGSSIQDNFSCAEKGVQVNIPIMPKFEGTVPANLPNGKKVKYIDAKEKTKYAVKRAGKELFEQFLQQLDDISGGCAQQLLSDIYKSKEVAMATNYEKILYSIGLLYRNTDKSNRQERLRLLSTVALHASNDTLKRFFQRNSKKRDFISVNEAEIVQAREYAKQFGPGIYVVPMSQVSWKNFALAEKVEPAAENSTSENEKESELDMAVEEKMNVFSSKVKGTSAGAIKEDASVRPDGSLSPVVPTFKADDEKRLITLEKLNRIEQKQGENGKEQLVTFKVTVKQAKEKVNGDERESTSVTGATDGGSDLNESQRTLRAELENETVSSSVDVSERSHGRRQRKSTGSLDSVDSKTKNQAKGRKKRSVDVQPKEIVKSTKDGNQGETPVVLHEKRKRTAFNRAKKLVLEQYFEKNIYASKATVEEISIELELDKKKIDNWFRNRRSKLKKDDEERLKRNVELKTRKGGKKATIEIGKQSVERLTDEALKNETAKEEEISIIDGKMPKNALTKKMSEGKVKTDNENLTENSAKENEIEEKDKEEKDEEEKDKEENNMEENDKEEKDEEERDFEKNDKEKSDKEENDTSKNSDLKFRNEQNSNLEGEELQRNTTNEQTLREIKEESTDKKIDVENIEGKVIYNSKDIDLHNKTPRVTDGNDKINECDGKISNVTSSFEPNLSTSKANEVKDKISSHANISIVSKEENLHLEDELEERSKGEQTERRAKDGMKPQMPALQPIGALNDFVVAVQDGDGEIVGKQNIMESVMKKVNFEVENIDKSRVRVQLPSLPFENMPCEEIITENVENRSELSGKTVVPTQFVEKTNVGLSEHSESDKGFSSNSGDELVRHIHDQKLEQTVDKPWSSIAQSADYSLGIMNDYESENVDSNVREDLALALNSDPEFMKDFSELMNIAKSY